jgi:capsular polysaccharide biosynthesis protein
MEQGVDSKALVTTLILKIPILLIFAVTGAIVGSGLNLIIASVKEKNAQYVSETEYYVEFAPGIYDAAQYYNAYTWNDIIGNDMILGRALELLGDGYDKAEIRNGLAASIYSDVRYLLITVKGDTVEYTEAVSVAIGQALSEFGETMNEFTRIYQVDEEPIVLESVPHFTIRAACLGAFIFFVVALFVIMFRFCIGSAFYTKRAVTYALEIPVLGMEFKNGSYEGVIDKPIEKYNDRFYLNTDDKENLIAIIPFGKTYREKAIDEIDTLRLKGFKVTGAIMVGVSSLWYRIYRGD